MKLTSKFAPLFLMLAAAILLSGLSACGSNTPAASAPSAQSSASTDVVDGQTQKGSDHTPPATGTTLSPTGASDAGTVPNRPRVYSTLYPLDYLVKRIGGEHIDTYNLVPAGAEPHDWEPTAKEMAALENANALVCVGPSFEHWVFELLPALSFNNLRVLPVTATMALLPADHEHEHHHEHADESHDEHADESHDEHADESHDEHADESHDEHADDPHFWSSPLLMANAAEQIRDLLIELDPQHEDAYRDNCSAVQRDLTELDQLYHEKLDPLSQRKVVVSHAAFAYLCRDYNLEQIAIEGITPDAEPDAARMAEVIKQVKADGIRVIFFETLASPKVAAAIAAETGAETAVLNPLEGLTPEEEQRGEDYFSLMRQNLDALLAALASTP